MVGSKRVKNSKFRIQDYIGPCMYNIAAHRAHLPYEPPWYPKFSEPHRTIPGTVFLRTRFGLTHGLQILPLLFGPGATSPGSFLLPGYQLITSDLFLTAYAAESKIEMVCPTQMLPYFFVAV